VGEGGEGGEEDGDDEGFSLLSSGAGKDVGRRRVSILGDCGSGSAGKEDVDDVLGLRRGVFGDRGSSLTLENEAKGRTGRSGRKTGRDERKIRTRTRGNEPWELDVSRS